MRRTLSLLITAGIMTSGGCGSGTPTVYLGWIRSYTVDASQLKLTLVVLYGTDDKGDIAMVSEDPRTVTVTVEVRSVNSDRPAVATPHNLVVTLKAPLAGRQVVDGSTRTPVRAPTSGP